MIKKLMLGTAVMAMMAGAASAKEVKIGILMGFTGPIESMTPIMSGSAQMAIDEVNAAHDFLGGATVVGDKADDTCTDASAATAAATRLVTSDHVAGIFGAGCSGVTAAVLQSVARPNGMVMISASATSPSLSTMPNDGLFFRTAPSDARQGVIMAGALMKRGIKNVAVTFTNNDYGKGLSDSFVAAYKKAGGTVTINMPHDDNKSDYSAEVASLASAGGDLLVVAGYVDKGGKSIIQGALDTGAFNKFYLPDGMYGQSLINAIGSSLNGSFGDVPGTDSPGHADFVTMAKKAGFDGNAVNAAESYDAVALMLLSMQAAKSSDPEVYKSKILEVANGPGEKIYPGELAKGLKLLSEGKPIDYVGASDVHLLPNGDSAGSYRIYSIKDGKQVTDYFM